MTKLPDVCGHGNHMNIFAMDDYCDNFHTYKEQHKPIIGHGYAI